VTVQTPDPGEQSVGSEPAEDPGGVAPTGLAERLKVIAGLIALGLGLLALVVIAGLVVAFDVSTTAAPIVSAAVSAIGSIVGAYFGIKLGKDAASDQAVVQTKQTKDAVAAQREEATKTQVALAHLEPEQARTVLHELGLLRDSPEPPP
jgi:arginine exporter protein ArgO